MSSLFGANDPTQGTYSASQISAAPAATDKKILDAEQAARQAWMDMGMEGRKQGVDPSVYQILYSTNAQGQTVRNSDGYVSPVSINSVQNPNAKEYYQQNPQELFALGALGGGGGQAYFMDAGVRGTDKKYGQLTPDQWYRGYTSNFADGWDKDTSSSYRWAGQDTPQRPSDGTAGTSSGASVTNGGSAAYVTPGATASASSAPQLGYNLSSVAGVTPWAVDNNQLVASQLEKIIASDSPLMQQARAQALQQMNARGTLNSSMAETAAQSAVIAAADKIAQADAATYGDAAQYNADATNTFTREGNAFIRQGVMADYNVNANEWAAQQAYAREMAAQREQNAFNLAAMERENELNKGNTTSANTQSDRQGYINALNESRKNWAIQYKELMADPNMSPENKKAAIKGLATSYNTQIKQYTGLLGWDYASWDIEYDDTEDATPATPAAATTPTDGGGGS